MYQLIEGDCLVEMKRIESGSVDAIICDLPYGTTACAWDVVIPFEPLWEQYKRVIKPKGAIVLFGSQPFTSALIMSNVEWFRDELIWRKDRATRFLDCNIRPMKSHENIIIFCSHLPTYNPQKTDGAKPASRSGKRSSVGLASLLRGGLYQSDGYGQTDRYQTSVLDFNVPNHGEFGLHPTQKPVSLLRNLIRTYTNEGDTVLDNCMGSGSTIVAALQTGRKAIGIERDATYFQIAKRRIEDAARAAAGQPKILTGHINDTAGLPMFAELT